MGQACQISFPPLRKQRRRAASQGPTWPWPLVQPGTPPGVGARKARPGFGRNSSARGRQCEHAGLRPGSNPLQSTWKVWVAPACFLDTSSFLGWLSWRQQPCWSGCWLRDREAVPLCASGPQPQRRHRRIEGFNKSLGGGGCQQPRGVRGPR